MACSAGQCLSVACNASALFCSEGHVEQCNTTGTAHIRYATCATDQYCSQTAFSASCVADVCTPGATGCSGEVIGTCNAEGSAFVATGTNCSSLLAYCYNGLCKSYTLEQIAGGASQLGQTETGYGVVLRADTDRILVGVELKLFTDNTYPRTGYWSVYESVSESGTYSIIAEGTFSYAMLYPGGAGQSERVSSDRINVPLRSGYHYLVAFLTDSSVASPYYTASRLSTPLALSFGSALRGFKDTSWLGRPPSSTAITSTTNGYDIALITITP